MADWFLSYMFIWSPSHLMESNNKVDNRAYTPILSLSHLKKAQVVPFRANTSFINILVYDMRLNVFVYFLAIHSFCKSLPVNRKYFLNCINLCLFKNTKVDQKTQSLPRHISKVSSALSNLFGEGKICFCY